MLSGVYRKPLVFLAILLFIGIALLVGWQRQPETGGDDRVTTERLSGSRLVDINKNLSWTFDASTVVIENRDRPLPQDLLKELVADGTTPKRVEATWKYDEKLGVLRLSKTMADGNKIDKDSVFPIKPAGQVRVNLGNRQYNLFRDANDNL